MPAAATDLVQPFYWDQFRDTPLDRYLFRREYAFIRRFLGSTARPRSLLDIGCGSGRVTLPLHGMGLDVVGMDLDPVPLAAFQGRSDAVPLVRGAALRLPFADGSFDCVVAMEVLGYTDDHRGFLQECHRVLSRGGTLIFHAVNRRSYKRVLKRLVGRAAGLGPAYNLSAYELMRATAAQGFDIQGVSGYYWMPFSRKSSSRLVGPAALLERALRLDRRYDISPWILVAASKGNW